MNTQRQVFKKLYPVKIELGLIDNLKGVSLELKNFSENVDIDLKEYESILNSLKVNRNDLNNSIDKAKSVISKAESALKDLGIPLNSSKELIETIDKLKFAESQLNKIKNIK